MTDPSTLPRFLEEPVRRALSSFPVVILTGARQTGKSTLARSLAERTGHRYLTLDDLETMDRAREAPDALLRGAERLILDEVQRSPDLLLAVKRAVDEDRAPGRFLLTGSANLLLMKRAAESLAGRAVHFTLWPLARRERLGLGDVGAWESLFDREDAAWKDLLEERGSPGDWREETLVGGYPVPAYRLAGSEERSLWFAGYTGTYLERDLRDLSEVASVVDFRRLMRALCLRLGNLVNQTEVGRDVGLSQPTVHRHLDLLEISYQLVRVPAFSVNRTKRLIKSPKIYWSDPALALHLAGEEAPRGCHLENLLLADLLAWSAARVDGPQILYWRTTTGEEVDFVIEWRGRLLPIEVKSGRRPRLQDAKSLRTFRTEYGVASRAGLLVHAGEDTEWLADGVLAVPWWRLI